MPADARLADCRSASVPAARSPSARSPEPGARSLPSLIRHERPGDHRDRRAAVAVDATGDDVEPAGAGSRAPAGEVVGGHEDDLPPLALA